MSAAGRAEYARSQERQEEADTDAMVEYGQQYAREHPEESEDPEAEALAREDEAAAAAWVPPPPPVRCGTPPVSLYRQCSNLRFDPDHPTRFPHPQWPVGMHYLLAHRLAVLDAKAAAEGVTPDQRAAAVAELEASVAAHAPATLMYLAAHVDDSTLSTIQSWASLNYVLSECRAHGWSETAIPLAVWTRLSLDFDCPNDPLLSGQELDQAKELMRQAQRQTTSGSGSAADSSGIGAASATK